MGDEQDAERRRALLAPYRLDEELMAVARDDAVALHCLPAHPGEEISEGVLYGERSAVWDQAENRLHAQKALLEWLVALISSGSPYEERIGFSRAVRVGDRVVVSGTAPVLPDGELPRRPPASRPARCLEIIAEALAEAGRLAGGRGAHAAVHRRPRGRRGRE